MFYSERNKMDIRAVFWNSTFRGKRLRATKEQNLNAKSHIFSRFPIALTIL